MVVGRAEGWLRDEAPDCTILARLRLWLRAIEAILVFAERPVTTSPGQVGTMDDHFEALFGAYQTMLAKRRHDRLSEAA